MGCSRCARASSSIKFAVPLAPSWFYLCASRSVDVRRVTSGTPSAAERSWNHSEPHSHFGAGEINSGGCCVVCK